MKLWTYTRRGLALSVLVALWLFAARAASAQQPSPAAAPPVRLSLGEAARLAAQQSAVAEGARLRVTEARARVRQSRSALLPNLSADVSQSAHTVNSASFGFDFPTPAGQKPLLDPNGQIIGPVNLTDVRARLQANLFDPSALRRVQAAEMATNAASAEASSAAEQSAAAAAAAYVRVLRSDAQLQARIADSTLGSELVSIARQQLTAGVGVALDVTRAAAQLAGVRAQLIAARNERSRTRLDLLRVLGLPLDTPLELTDSLGRTAPADTLVTDEGAAVDRALRTRPDLRAADEQIRAAQQQISAIRAERLPSLGVIADDGLNGKKLQYMLPTYTWALQVSVPVFDGFRREARQQEQETVVRELDVRRRDLRQQAATEVRAALLDLSSAREQVDAARERLQLGEQEVEQARERFRAGVAGNADVITASLNLNSARTLYVDALTALQSARVGLARAEGVVTELR